MAFRHYAGPALSLGGEEAGSSLPSRPIASKSGETGPSDSFTVAQYGGWRDSVKRCEGVLACR